MTHARPGAGPGPLLNSLAIFAALLVTAVFVSYVNQRAINVPFHDDILDIVQFLMRWADTEGLVNHLQLLHEQHNDHRTAASRLVYIGSFVATGEINFRLLMLLANSALVLLLAGFYSQIRQQPGRYLLLLCACLIMMHPRDFNLLTFPMAAFAFFYLYAYSFISLLLLHRRGWPAFLLAILFALAANFSIASGQITWVFGLFVLIYRHWRGIENNRLKMLVWLICMLCSLVLFHVGLETPNDILTLILSFLKTPLHQTQFFVIMVGSVTGYESVFMATLLGLVYLALLCLLSWRDWPAGLTAIHWYAWFIVASIAVLALGRAIYVPVDYALAPRYSFASMNLLVCLFLLVFQQQQYQQLKYLSAAVALALTVCAANYQVYTPVYDAYKQRRVDRYNQNKHWIFGYPMKQTKAIVNEAIERGYYIPPPQPMK